MTQETLQRISTELALIETTDTEALTRVHRDLLDFLGWAEGEQRTELVAEARVALNHFVRVLNQESAEPGHDLGRVGECVDRLMAMLLRPGRDAESADNTEEDDGILADFLVEQEGNLEDLESLVMEIDGGQGSEEVLDALRGRIHTLKGEAGVLDIPDVATICHLVEDRLEENAPELLTDVLLATIDWASQTLRRASKRGARAAAPRPGCRGHRAAGGRCGHGRGGGRLPCGACARAQRRGCTGIHAGWRGCS